MYDADEQQQIDAIKNWWRRHGRIVLIVFFLALAALFAFVGYRHYRAGQEEKASALYSELMQSEQDNKKAAGIANDIIGTYPKTAYAPRAALFVAKAAYGAGDAKEAEMKLNWVLDHAEEPELKDIARLQVARILFDRKQYAAAVQLLDAKHGDAFDGLYAALKGDLYLAQNNVVQARSAYTLALSKLDRNSAYHNLIQLKLDSMGEGK